jgi:hypothetical protein
VTGTSSATHPAPPSAPTTAPTLNPAWNRGQDRAAGQLLDGGAFHIHGHVPGAVAITDQEQPDGGRQCTDLVAEGEHDQAQRQQAGQRGHGPGRPEAVHHHSGQWHRHDRPECHREQDQPELRRGGLQGVADLRDAGGPAGEAEAAADEGDVDRTLGAESGGHGARDATRIC